MSVALLCVLVGMLFGPLFALGVFAVAATRAPMRNMVLFILTCLTTWQAGGWQYAVALMTILLTHEMGHYLAARRHHVHTSLPYFVPMPLSILGTFGAIIVARSPFPTRREVFDVGVAGPLAGFAVAVPAWVGGLALSSVESRTAFEAAATGGISLEFGDSLLTWATSALFFPGLADDSIIVAHPLAIAGWVGLILTAINLLPAGSLDGGHIAYAFFWRQHRRLSIATAIGMMALGCFALDFHPAEPLQVGPFAVPLGFDGGDPRVIWLVWGGLVTVFALNHPPPLFPHVPMTRRRRWVALATLCIFVLTFVPAPLRISGEPERGTATDEPEPERHPAPERRDQPRPDRDPRRGRTLDVRAGPELRVSLRHGAA